MPRNLSVVNGTKMQNASTNNMHVQVSDVENQYGPIVFVLLGSGSVFLDIQIMC